MIPYMVTAVEQLLSEQLRVLHCKVPGLSIVYKLGYFIHQLDDIECAGSLQKRVHNFVGICNAWDYH